ncbi:cobyrinate a,c-diamide synthase [Sebaldella sp. S0638]|uniref:cobyrinate a,c-diamide synthase n=1 Tax=Sebaldella sp. S0638 TaxID=2957809 RepID=UPI00209D02DF|nr:cobyrinate a,c-diamide synthase [Sebaldella sp. S0638]MCP1225044.1 cobyrinate a,c-diamide synthase [Sebaldella sp. S0638]
MRKILIAGTMSGSGKTTASSILMSAFENVAPFKIGPDYIDPGYHRLFTGNGSYNLDSFMFDEDTLKYIFEENSKGKDIAVIEGVMGLYDGINHTKDNFSTAHTARILDVPVILVVNAKGISTSIAAEILGFVNFDKDVNIAGVILNNVSGEKLYLSLKEAVEKYTGIECLGYIPKDEKIGVESRHLGLKQAFEVEDSAERKEFLKDIGEKYLNLKRIYEIAESSKEYNINNPADGLKDIFKGKRAAVARDKAFSFYYESNFDMMRHAGLELVEFSPVYDSKIPENIDFIYLGGGYPELYAEELAGNTAMKKSITEAHEAGIPIYAECGGFIYLTDGLKTTDEKFYEFCGILDMKIAMKKRLNMGRFGYIHIDMENGIKTKGHEFHYSDIFDNNEKHCFYSIKKEDGREWKCGYKKGNTLAGYPHIAFYSEPEFLKFLFGMQL